jgi:hypothetical protein
MKDTFDPYGAALASGVTVQESHDQPPRVRIDMVFPVRQQFTIAVAACSSVMALSLPTIVAAASASRQHGRIGRSPTAWSH